MDDEVLARLAALVGVMDARVDERLLDARAFDGDRRLLGMLFDDREQVAEQTPLGCRELDPLDRLVRAGVGDAIDGQARGGDERGRQMASVLTGRGATAALSTGLGNILGVPAAERSAVRVRGQRVTVRAAGPVQPLGRSFALLRNRRPSSYRCA
jgi:hypothetical protein